jgi:hypothetical protein
MAIAIQTLRDEGVLEIGGIAGTSFVYVITRERTYLFHAAELPSRRLDTYGAQRAIHWIELGAPSCRVAADLGVTESELRRALRAAGYARMSPAQHAQLANARAQRKLGNRRGRLVRIAEHACGG